MGLIADQLTNIDNLHAKNVALQICRFITSRYTPDTIYWFGSSVNNQMNKASDIDIAVLFSSKELLIKARPEIIKYIESFDEKIDISFFVTEFFNKRKNLGGIPYIIKTTGKIIYDKNTSV